MSRGVVFYCQRMEGHLLPDVIIDLGLETIIGDHATILGPPEQVALKRSERE